MYIVLPDDTAKKREIISYQARTRIYAEIIKKREITEDFDLIIEYYDTWRWNLKKY